MRQVFGELPVWMIVFVAVVTVAIAGVDRQDGGETSGANAEQESLRELAIGAVEKAARYFHSRAAAHGGYVYYYSLELEQRWGEGVATKDQIFVQPPGTPAVGMAYLKAYAATDRELFREAAREAAHALVYGQLKSGGWTQVIDFDPAGSRVALYRNGKGKGRNHTSLDDDQTQSAIRFLAEMDHVLEFKDRKIHDAVQIALDALLKAQFANGGFPQGFTGPVAAHPIVKAAYPDSWPRIWPNEKYWEYYTLNDGLAGSVCDTLLSAMDVYGDQRYRSALLKLGDFLIAAQMPEPQPAWAQQYDFHMHPVWARKFEPPAIAGLESEDAIAALMKIYRATGERKYLAPIPPALAYLKRSILPDGRMARYYELESNRPLYMQREGANYVLTYDDSNLPSHYGWKQRSELARLEREFHDLQDGRPSTLEKKVPIEELEAEVRRVIGELDSEGRWISTYAGERLVGQPKFTHGFRFISSAVFVRNVEIISDYLSRVRLEHRKGSTTDEHR